MIFDCIENSAKYSKIHKDIKKIFLYLSELSEDLIPGKAMIREGEVWMDASVIFDKITEEKKPEAHRMFIDVHYVVCGAEKFGYESTDKLKPCNDYNADTDTEWYEGEVQSSILRKGEFALVFPGEAHIPCMEKMSESKLVHVVVKLKI